MAAWMTPKLLSMKCGIPESTLRIWKSLGYIVSSTIDNEVLMDEDSLNIYLNAHRTKQLSEDYLKKIIKDKELELEVILSQLDDELFLMKTHKQYQQLFHIVMQELGQLITDERLREIFLVITSGEPISRVAARFEMTYERTLVTYQSILKDLSGNMERISTIRNRKEGSLFARYGTEGPMNMSLSEFLPFHPCAVLSREADINTLSELLKYTSVHGWRSLRGLRGMGKVSYALMMNALQKARFIIIHQDDTIEVSPELAVWVM